MDQDDGLTMGYARRVTAAITTSSLGTATVYAPTATDSRLLTGRLIGVAYTHPTSGAITTTTASGGSVAITISSQVGAQTMLTLGATGTVATGRYAPRQPTHTATGGTATGPGTLTEFWLVEERIKVVVVRAGASQVGTFTFTVA